MNCRRVIFAAALSVAAAAGPTGRSRADDVPKLSLRRWDAIHRGVFPYDFRAHLQLDGKAVTLIKRLALSGSRYSGSGVTLKTTRAGATTLKRAKLPVTACALT